MHMEVPIWVFRPCLGILRKPQDLATTTSIRIDLKILIVLEFWFSVLVIKNSGWFFPVINRSLVSHTLSQSWSRIKSWTTNPWMPSIGYGWNLL